MSDPLFALDGRSVLVAGAAGGLGRAVTEALAARGAHLLLADSREDALGGVGVEAANARRHGLDVTDEASCEAAVAAAVGAFGTLDGVVNCTGVLDLAPAEELDAARMRRTLEVNVVGAHLLSRAAAATMRPRGQGRIVHMASVSSVVVNPDYAAYATSKAGLSQLVRVLAREWAGDGVTVNAIGPAMTPTGMTGDYLARSAFAERAKAAIPMGRFGEPRDVLGVVILLLAPAGGFITGQTILADGGRSLA